MVYSLDDAKALIYSQFQERYDGMPLEDATLIVDESTITKQWGWIFTISNARYVQTRDPRRRRIGAGPIFFNRETGEIRRFGSGGNLEWQIYDYEMELAAEGGCWCLWISSDQGRKQTILNLKRAFAITTVEAMALAPVLPYCLFTGVRRDLDWVSHQLKCYGVLSMITLERPADRAHPHFTSARIAISYSLAESYYELVNA